MDAIRNQSLGISYDDVLLQPGFSDFSRSEIDLSTTLTKTITLKAPFISSPMDTVTEHEMAIALAELGGVGIIHRNLSIDNEAGEVSKVKKEKLLVGAAVGASKGYEERVKALVAADVDIIVVDSAHGNDIKIIKAVQFIKKTYPKVQIMAGNIATADGAARLIEAGADCLRVGMGPGAICTTRIVSGMGVPQMTAVADCVSVAHKKGIPIVADGGINYSGDMVKALAAGANTVMMGSMFAACEEAPGKVVEVDADHVPARFKNILKNGSKSYKFKEYRGMGSVGAMEKGAEIKSEDEYHGKDYGDRVLVAEGVEGLVPVKGNVKRVLDQAIGGIKSGMYYVGSKTISHLQEHAKFIRITQASLTESHPHDIFVTNPGESYT